MNNKTMIYNANFKKIFIYVLSKNISQYHLKQDTLKKCFTVKKDSIKAIQ